MKDDLDSFVHQAQPICCSGINGLRVGAGADRATKDGGYITLTSGKLLTLSSAFALVAVPCTSAAGVRLQGQGPLHAVSVYVAAQFVAPREVGSDDGSAYFAEVTENGYVAVDEQLLPEDGPEEPETVYFVLARPKIEPIFRSGDTVRVRVNVPVQGGGDIGIIRSNPISATIPAGATFTGRDKNRNNVPDALEDLINKGTIRLCPC